jgi:putative ABC transport system substrate-binding protein
MGTGAKPLYGALKAVPERLGRRLDHCGVLRLPAPILNLEDCSPYIRGWINYYGHFYRTRLRPTLQRIDLQMRRREFIAGFIVGVGATAAWPAIAHAQQPKMPVIAYLSSRSSQSDSSMLVAFRRGLTEAGYVEGRNVAIEYRFADGEYDHVPTLFTELTRQQVAVIVFAGFLFTWVRLVRTSQIPVIFNTGGDLVGAGLVASYNRPGGNVTGINTLVGATVGKHVSLLHELVPNATTIAVLSSLPGSASQGGQLEQAQEAAASLRLQLLVLDAKTESEINAAFASFNQRRPDGLIVFNSPFFLVHAKLIAALAARHGVPAIYPRREFAEAGGLMSYGYDVADGYREMGHYAGRILKGEKPANLPVFQPTRFQFVINLKTAKTLGLTVPPNLLAIADEVIE